MKNESNNKMNVNQIGLRSLSYLQNKFQKLNNAKKDQVSFRKDNSNAYNVKQIKSNNYSSFGNIDNDGDENIYEGNDREIFPNDSFGDYSKKHNISEVLSKGAIENGNQSDLFPLSIDIRIEYVLKCLDLLCLNEVFSTHNMNFNDMLFLSKEDYHELGLNMIQRNRLMKFCEAFQLEGREYNYEEVISFFKKKKRYMIKGKDDNNNDYQATACFANEYPSTSSRYGYNYGQDEARNVFNNEIFMPQTQNNKNNIHYIINESPHNNNQLSTNVPCKSNSTLISKQNNHLNIDGNHSIEHTELQYSSSMSNMSKSFLNKSSSSSFKRNCSQSNIISSYQKMAQEIDYYMNNFSNKRRDHQTTSSNNHIMTNNSSRLQDSLNRKYCNHKKNKNIYLNSIGHIETNGSQSKLQKSKQMKFQPSINKIDNGFINYIHHKDNKFLFKGQQFLNITSHQPVNDSNCESHKFTKSSSSVDLLSECYRKKDNLKSSLVNCTNNINESRKVSLYNLYNTLC